MSAPCAMPTREHAHNRVAATARWDVVVIGGGIIGVAVAREAVRAGLDVLLLEQNDFASGTSSRSSKMVHGGLRYIANGDFHLTLESVREREHLLRELPGLVEPMPYLFGNRRGQFPGRFIFSALLALYDVFARKRQHRFIGNDELTMHAPRWNGDGLHGASQYIDALTDDSRLVLRLLNEACDAGAAALNYARVVELLREGDDVCGVVVEDGASGETYSINAGVIVNATGAWADNLRSRVCDEKKIRPLRGSHLVISAQRLPVYQCITFMHAHNGRPVFIFPWEGVTVVGTTDVDHKNNLDAEAVITRQEFDYLMSGIASQFPACNITAADVLSTYAGVRPVIGSGKRNPSKEKRTHSVWNDSGMITVTGGKLTTFRVIALEVLQLAQQRLPTNTFPLAAADHAHSIFSATDFSQRPHYLGVAQWRRLCGRYGTTAARYLATLSRDWLLPVPGTCTLWAELAIAAQEMPQHLDDILLRRTRIGNLLPRGGMEHIALIREICGGYLAWDEGRWQDEIGRYETIVKKYYSVPA
jgi:glycerol-3-phosphate dehydrogenase